MKKKMMSILMTTVMVMALPTAVFAGENDQKNSDADYSSVKIGTIVSNGVDDGGWGQAQVQGVKDAAKDLGISDDNLEWVENISETGTDCANAIEGLMADGCIVIIGASTGYKSTLEQYSKQYPDVQFAQADGTSMNGNLVGYQIRSYDGMFVMGYLSALMSDQDALGYSAGQPEASVIQGINAYALGAKYANPDATVRVVWSNSWYDPTAESECANSLISLGIKTMGINASSPAIPKACEQAGALCTGYHVDMKDYAPKAVMASYMWNWAPIFEDFITQFASTGKPVDTDYYWGADKNCSTISDINTDIVPEDIAKKTQDLYQEICDDKLNVLAGEIKDNEGNVIVKEGEVMSDDQSRKMDFLVDNVIGQLP